MSRFTRKILLTVTASVFCLVLALGTLFAVLAQQNMLISTDISVFYKSEINATVAARYWMVGDTSKQTLLADGTDITMANVQTESANITLSENQDYVVFEYVFRNSMTNLDAYAHLSYEDTGDEDKNIYIYTATNDTEVDPMTEVGMGYYDPPAEAYAEPRSNILVPANSYVYVYIRIGLSTLAEDAIFTGTFSWSLTLTERATDINFFEISGNTITKYKGGAGDYVVIPDTNTATASGVSFVSSGSDAITAIGDGAFQSVYCDFTKIKLADTIRSIGDYAFTGSFMIESIIFSKNLNTIGEEAFFGCYGLTSLELPDSLTSIGSMAFADCLGVERINPLKNISAIGPAAFCGTAIKSIDLSQTSISMVSASVFSGCYQLTDVVLPTSVMSIEQGAFEGSPIENINLSDLYNLDVIGANAFKGTALKNADLPEGLLSIDANAFQAAALQTATLPSSLTAISAGVFNNCANLEVVTIPEGITTISDNMFKGCTKLASINLPSTIRTIGASAFESCSSIKKLTIPEGVATIKAGTFKSNLSLTHITIPSTMTAIEDTAFTNCKAVVEIVNKSALNLVVGDTTYGEVARYALAIIGNESESKEIENIDGFEVYDTTILSYVGNATSATTPAGMTNIKSYAFSGNETLLSLELAEGIVSIGDFIIDGSTIQSVNVPASLTTSGIGPLYSDNLLTLTYNEGITNIDGVASGSGNVTQVNLPSTARVIGGSAFIDFTSLTTIVIPEGVTRIEDHAFSTCWSLYEIDLPSTLEYIGWYAFAYCSALETVIVPEGVTTLCEAAFYNCANLKNATLPESLTTLDVEHEDFPYIFDGADTPITLTVVGNIDAWIVSRIANSGVSTVKVVGTRTECDFYFENGGSYSFRDVTTLDLSEAQGMTKFSIYLVSSNLKTIIMPSTLNDITGFKNTGWDGLTIIASNEYMYNAMGNVDVQIPQSETADGIIWGAGNILDYVSVFKVLKSVVDNAATQNTYLESSSYTKTTETIDGEVYYVYTKK